jgi:hypothetical protein
MPLQPWRLPELEVGAASSGVASLDVTRRGRNRRGLGLAAGARGRAPRELKKRGAPGLADRLFDFIRSFCRHSNADLLRL